MKELAIEVISALPDNATLEDIIDAIYTRLKIEQGLNDVENGDIMTEEEALRELEN